MPDLRDLTDRPPRTEFLGFSPPLLGDEEKAEVMDTLDSGWLSTGPKTELFRQRVLEYTGASHAIAVNSCTAALQLSVVVAGVGEGDEVITTPYTFASTAHVVMYQRAKPVFVDIDPVTCNIDPDRIEDAITPRTRAIIPVHYGGYPCDMDAILDIAKRRNLTVIEDAAHAIGAEYQGRKVGTLGDMTCFSFYATKNMTTGEGGMITLEDPELAERLHVLSMYGISDARDIWSKRYAPRGTWFYDIQELGFKVNMMDIQAALGIHQLARLDGFTARRQHFAEMYAQGFADLPEIIVPPFGDEGNKHVWHLYPIRVRAGALKVERDRFIAELGDEKIGTSVMFRPLHLHSLYREALGYEPGSFPMAEAAFEGTISLPVSPIMTDDDVLDTIAAVQRIVAKHRR